MNDSMKKMIACVLSDPHLVNQVASDSIVSLLSNESIPDSKILLDLIEQAKFQTDIKNKRFGAKPTRLGLLELYEDSPRTQQWLKSCYKSDKPLNKKNAKKEFLIAWSDAVDNDLHTESNGTSDEDFVSDESDNQKAFDELYGETLEEERDSLLAQNENLKNQLDYKNEALNRDYVSKDKIKSERKFRTPEQIYGSATCSVYNSCTGYS